MQGLKEWPEEDRPPVLLTFLSFRVMVGIGTLLPILCIWAFLRRNKLTETPRLLRIMLYAIPCPTSPSRRAGSWRKWAVSHGSCMV